MACIDPNCNTGCSCNNCCPPTPPIPTPTPPACVGTDCTELYDSSCITYTGVAIPCLEITQGMNLTTVIQNMAAKLCETCVPQPPPILTKVIFSQCDETLTSIDEPVEAIPVAGATQYEFNVTDGVTTIVIPSDEPSFLLSQFPGGGVLNTEYTITVRSKGASTAFTAYGDACVVTTPSFVCPDCVEIPEGVTIGTQNWKQCNATHVTYRDGISIPEVTDPTAWSALTTGAWCYYDNDPANGPIYGKLYNWYAVAGIYDASSLSDPLLRKQFAPLGYHVPSGTEWTVLTDYLGGSTVAGGEMKAIGTIEGNDGCWTTPNTDATNNSGFKCIPAGIRDFSTGALFQGIGAVSELWTALQYDISESTYILLTFNNGTTSFANYNKNAGMSVRLIKDYEIGDLAYGGVVAHLLEEGDEGYNPNVQHGLIATIANVSVGAEWGCEGVLIGSDGIIIGTGNQNTEDIVAGCLTAGIAAKLCKDLVQGGYNDWYLPSKDELNQLYINRVAIGGFSTSNYWSSSEDTSNGVWYQDFSDGSTNDYSKTNLTAVRAIRTF